MAIALGNDFLDFRGDAAVANGWFKYARRLLKPLPTFRGARVAQRLGGARSR
jgi:hypothetical protein